MTSPVSVQDPRDLTEAQQQAARRFLAQARSVALRAVGIDTSVNAEMAANPIAGYTPERLAHWIGVYFPGGLDAFKSMHPAGVSR